MSKRLHGVLLRLLKNGQLSASQLTSAQRQELDAFRARTNALGYQTRGRGVVYTISQRAIVEQHLSQLAPLAAADINATLPQRAANIGRSRNSKSGQHYHERYYLLFKAQGEVTWHQDHDASLALDLGAITLQQGAASLAISANASPHFDPGWHTTGALWLVENQALFDQLDWLPNDEHTSVIWYSGHLRTALLEWLARRPRAAHVYLFPDYDGVGLQNYLRLKRQLADQVSFWLMPNWQQKLSRFGNNLLWQNTHQEFQSAAPHLLPLLDNEQALALLITAMQRQGLALEQEAVWLPI